MIVYVETNFVLQLALRQEEANAADAILERAQSDSIKLVLPAFSLSEPYSTLTYRSLERRSIYNSLDQQLTLLRRSEPHRQTALALQQLLSMWGDLETRETDWLHSAIVEILMVGRAIQVELEDIQQSALYRKLYDLSPQDAIILSVIVRDLGTQDADESKCFISTNVKDFRHPGIRAELKSLNCRYISKLADSLDFIDNAGSA
ncbi:MAG: PIN domain-containing protein [Chloroflexota bacterium]|nr:PIN domain-containing protein [Chloroflexota bacterium]MDQ5865255.1 PIN domain-containing protein [Chloroflexota bacterium]